MNTVALLGDTHGSMTSPFSIIRAMGDSEYGIVAGDFGYWPRTGWYADWIKELDERLFMKNKRLWFVDGNHEDFQSLAVVDAEAPIDSFGAKLITENVGWFRRGTRWEWYGKTFLAMGGAPSIDKDYRLMMEGVQKKPRTHWFYEEEITLDDIDRAGTDPVDYLVTHDGPSNIPMKLYPFGDMSRQMLSKLADDTKPKVWFHGHYHRFMTYDYPQYNSHTTVYCLDESHGKPWYGTLYVDSGLFAL